MSKKNFMKFVRNITFFILERTKKNNRKGPVLALDIHSHHTPPRSLLLQRLGLITLKCKTFNSVF